MNLFPVAERQEGEPGPPQACRPTTQSRRSFVRPVPAYLKP